MPTKLARRRKSPDQVIKEKSVVLGLETGRIHALMGEAGDEMMDITPIKKYAAGGTLTVGGSSGGMDDLERRRLELQRQRLGQSQTYLGTQQGILGSQQADFTRLQAARQNAPEQQAVALARRNQAISDRDYGAYGVAPAEVDTPVTPGAVGIRQRIQSSADVLERQIADRNAAFGFQSEQAGLTRQAGGLSLDEQEMRLEEDARRRAGQQERSPATPLARSSPGRSAARSSGPKPGKIRNVPGYGMTRYEHGGQVLFDDDEEEPPRRSTRLAKKPRNTGQAIHQAFVDGERYDLQPGETVQDVMQARTALTAKREGKVAYTDPYGESALPEYLSPREATARKTAASTRKTQEAKTGLRRTYAQQFERDTGLSAGGLAEPDEWEGVSNEALLDLATTTGEGGRPLIPYPAVKASLIKRGLRNAAIEAMFAEAKLSKKNKYGAGAEGTKASTVTGGP